MILFFLRLQEKWNEIQSFAPLHMMKVEFRLDEETFNKYVKDVEKELTAETNSFHRNEDVGGIMKQHTQFFTTSGLKLKIEECLRNLSRLSKTFTEKMPENLVLQESYAKHQEHWDSLLARIQSLAAQLQQIPEQWKTYEAKFSSMVTWMDSIDASLAKMFKGISSDKDFEVIIWPFLNKK